MSADYISFGVLPDVDACLGVARHLYTFDGTDSLTSPPLCLRSEGFALYVRHDSFSNQESQ